MRVSWVRLKWADGCKVDGSAAWDLGKGLPEDVSDFAVR